MNKTSRVFILTLTVIFVFVSQVRAAFVWPVQEWRIPFIGSMKTPDGFSAVEVKDFSEFVKKEKKNFNDPKKQKQLTTQKTVSRPEWIPDGTPPVLKDMFPMDKEAANQRFFKSDVGLYHLSMDDGEAIHMAWFLAFRDGEKLPSNADFFNKELEPAQAEKLAELKKWIDENIDKAQFTDPNKKVSLKLLEMLPLQSLTMQKGSKLWTAGGRILVTVNEMPYAFFSRIYAVNIDGHLVMGVLAGFDGERPFWDPVVRNILLGLEVNPGQK